MSADKILVTGVGGDIGVNILRCLQDGPDKDNLIGCDIDPFAWGRDVVKQFLRAPRATDTEEYCKFIVNAGAKHGVKYVYPSSEAEISLFHASRALFASTGIVPIINKESVLNPFLDKFKTVTFLMEQGLPFPKTMLLEEFNGNMRFPFILKKRVGSGSKIVLIVQSKEELDFYRKKYGAESLVAQELIGTKDQEYTAGVFSDGKTVHSILFRRTLASDVGITRFAELVGDNPTKALCEKIARGCGLVGSINVQMRRRGEEFVPFEVNPRISGTAYARHHFGFKDIQWWLDVARGGSITYLPKLTKGVAVRAVQEVFLDVC